MESVRDWYLNKYNDDLGKKINKSLTFKDVEGALKSGKNFYNFIGVCDSIIRERIFSKLAELNNKSYDYYYYLWLNN